MREQAGGRLGMAWDARATGIIGALLLVAAGCSTGSEPQATVSDLDWACGTARCTATFVITAGEDAETLLVRVRAYVGAGVADRKIVGEQRERVSLRAGATRRLTVSVPTQRPADRLRVILELDRD